LPECRPYEIINGKKDGRSILAFVIDDAAPRRSGRAYSVVFPSKCSLEAPALTFVVSTIPSL
jgi:hypothetical protein